MFSEVRGHSRPSKKRKKNKGQRCPATRLPPFFFFSWWEVVVFPLLLLFCLHSSRKKKTTLGAKKQVSLFTYSLRVWACVCFIYRGVCCQKFRVCISVFCLCGCLFRMKFTWMCVCLRVCRVDKPLCVCSVTCTCVCSVCVGGRGGSC